MQVAELQGCARQVKNKCRWKGDYLFDLWSFTRNTNPVNCAARVGCFARVVFLGAAETQGGWGMVKGRSVFSTKNDDDHGDISGIS